MQPANDPRAPTHDGTQLHPSGGTGSLLMPLDATYAGHVAHPACPAPWTPLSPSTCQHVSPQVASQYARFVSADQRHAQQVPVQRPFLSAVPMGAYSQMPASAVAVASPQQRSGYMSAQHSRHPSSFKGSPSVAQPVPAGALPQSSPAVSDARSRLASQLSPSMIQPSFSSRAGDSIPAVPSHVMPYAASDYSLGALHEPPVPRAPSGRD